MRMAKIFKTGICFHLPVGTKKQNSNLNTHRTIINYNSLNSLISNHKEHSNQFPHKFTEFISCKNFEWTVIETNI